MNREHFIKQRRSDWQEFEILISRLRGRRQRAWASRDVAPPHATAEISPGNAKISSRPRAARKLDSRDFKPLARARRRMKRVHASHRMTRHEGLTEKAWTALKSLVVYM